MASKPAISKQASKPAQQQVVATQWQGPLPSPDALASFDKIVTNGAERIFQMVEEEQRHRQAYENAHLKATAGDTMRGHYIGLGISLAAIGASTYVASLGAHWSVSVALVGVPMLGIVRAILANKTPPK